MLLQNASELLDQLLAAEPSAPSLPGVFRQPALTAVRRDGADVDMLSRQWTRAWLRQDLTRARAAREALEHEFAPLLAWALACWDFLLTTEGCRFLLRKPGEKWGMRGDYRACAQPDYHRLIIHCFRGCLAHFAHSAADQPLTAYLLDAFWPAIGAAYRALNQPPDARQRMLTAYSYLRCVPYHFLNDYHQTLVHRVVATLAAPERRVIECYYFHFFTEPAVAQAATMSPAVAAGYRQRGLRRIARTDALTCALLRQIERY